MESGKRWPGQSDEAYPEVFNVPPPQPKELKEGQLTQDQINHFFDDGFIIIKDFFDTEKDLEPVKKDIAQLVDELAHKLYNAGLITSLYSEAGFFERLTLIDEEFPGANLILHKTGRMPEAVTKLWSNDKVLNVVEQLLGSGDVLGHPVWNIRTKTPQNEATNVPWHQVSAYLDNSSYKVRIITGWIPLLDATTFNGCVQVMRGGHKKGRVAPHQCAYGGRWHVMISDEDMAKTLDIKAKRDCVTCSIPYGGLLLFTNMLPHRSLPNYSNEIRWSLDLRWQAPNQPVGFYGLKEGLLLRSASNPNLKVDFDAFNAVNRHTLLAKACNLVPDEFDTSVPGPWMKKWEVVHDVHISKVNEKAERRLKTVPQSK